jgi:O-antigen/teichoic acid export membrane protein
LRVRRSILNFGTSALFLVVTTLVALKSTPLLIKWLGEKRFGGSRIVFDTYGYLTLLELGLGGAIGPLLSRAIGLADERALRETVAAGARAYVRVALYTLAVGLALTPLVPRFAKDLIGAEVTDLRMAWVVGLGTFLTLPLLPLRTVIEARQLGYVVNLLLTAQALMITGLSLLMAWLDLGITGQAAAQMLSGWTYSLALAVIVTRANPGLFHAMLTVPTAPETRIALRNLSVPTLVLNISGRVSVLTDNLVVGGLLGTERVTSLVSTQRLVMVGQAVLQGVGGSSWAALAELHTQGERETFNRRLIEMTRMVAVLGVIGLVPIVAYNQAFFRLWLKGTVAYGGDLVAVLAAVNAVLLAEQSLWAWCFTATGKIREVVVQASVAAVLNLAVSVALTNRLGLVGPLLGTTVAFVAVGLWALPWRLNRVFGTPLVPLAKALGVPFVVGAAAAWVLHWLVSGRQPAGWGGLAVEMSLAALVMLVLSVALLMTAEDRSLWRVRLRGLWPKGE